MGFVRKYTQRLTTLAVLWLVFTLSLVGWWWYHALTTVADDRLRRMFLWEGGFLFFVLFAGGVGLIYLTYHHQRHHERLKMFFSTFAHDLKTSMTRLRLQGELLEESGASKDPKVLGILKNIQKLDLQLENSLWMAQIDSDHLLIQPTKLSEMMEHLRNEFSEIRFGVSRDAKLAVDRRAFIVILRNLFHNAKLHGGAEKIDIQVSEAGSGQVLLEIVDDGSGLKLPVEKLGHQFLSGDSKRGNGLGLYLSRRLLERMDGNLKFKAEPRFANLLTVKGSLG